MALDTLRRQQAHPVKHWHAKQYQQSLCRAYTEESIRHLAAIMRQREDSPAARVQAANVLLDRGWGKPPQAHTGAALALERWPGGGLLFLAPLTGA